MITEALYKQLESLIEQKGIQLYDVEFLKENDSVLLRISLFRKEGISLEHCEQISHLISPLLDVELENLNAYHLEVSSPGIERVLKKPQHFACSIGEKVEVRLQNKTIIKGILENYTEQEIQVREINLNKSKQKKLQQEETKIHTLALTDCKKIKTLFDWDSYMLIAK